ncbi:hypothetical protein NL676_021855 [Syzygium grande]|nr:hypothetical protein NL676_021855 [Syzygium grande]
MIIGIKGLVDMVLTKRPNIFIRPADELTEDGISFSLGDVHLPVIDRSQIQSLERRKAMVDEVKAVLSKWGFFWLVNHRVPRGLIEDMPEGIRQFNEGDVEEKKRLYSRDTMRNVIYYSNFSLYHSRTASWRDTFAVSSQVSDSLKVPIACK